MKKLFQLNLLLLLISSATAQESQPQETSPQQPSKILRVYDWKDNQRTITDATRRKLSDGEIISMDGMPVLKIENTNTLPIGVSLLKISDPSIIKRTDFVYCEVKYERNINSFDGSFTWEKASS
jgi:hypothetical protein